MCVCVSQTTSKEEQNRIKFSSIAYSNEELRGIWTIVHDFWPESEHFGKNEENGANFSFVAPSSEELWVRKEIDQNALL